MEGFFLIKGSVGIYVRPDINPYSLVEDLRYLDGCHISDYSDNTMSEITKEFLQESLKKLATKDDVQEIIEVANKGFDNVQQQFEGVKERLTSVEAKLDRVLYKELDRHEHWIKQLADKVGLELTR